MPRLYYDPDTGAIESFTFEEVKEFFLKDISFGLALENEQELNIGDAGYNKNIDNGSFITRANINFSGVGNQELFGSTIDSMIYSGLGYVPVLGDILTAFDLTQMFVQNTMNDFRNEVEYGDYYNTQYYNSKQEQLRHYSNLNKVAVVEVLSEDEHPLLFGRSTEDDYIRGVFTLGQTDDWYTRAIDAIKLSVVSESTNLLGESTITSCTTAERSISTNIRTIQTKTLQLENSETVSLLSNGIGRFIFQTPYDSEYAISIAQAHQMIIKIDGEVAIFSNNKTTKLLSSGDHVIEIIGNNSSKMISSIFIEPKTIDSTVSNVTISLKSNAQYLIKVTGLSKVKALNSGHNNIVIQSIFVNNSWEQYNNYNTIVPARYITHPFLMGDYYIILKNNTTNMLQTNFSISEPTVITKNSGITVQPSVGNYTYFKFTGDDVNANYILTATDISELSLIVLNDDSDLTINNGELYVDHFFKFGVNGGATAYIGVKNNDTSGNTISISRGEISYEWGITPNGSAENRTTSGSYLAARNNRYTLKLYINNVEIEDVVFSYINQSTAFGTYIFSCQSDNIVTIAQDCPIGGNGILFNASIEVNGEIQQKTSIFIIPALEQNMPNIITGLINTDDMQFAYSVSKYITGFDYVIYPNNTLFRYEVSGSLSTLPNQNSQIGIVSFKNNYLSLNYNTPTNLRIDVKKIHYLNAFNSVSYMGVNIVCNYSMHNMFAGGSGTSSSPYQITHKRHFENIQNVNDKYYVLNNNLTLSNKTSFFELEGTFDGNSKRITLTSYLDYYVGDIGLFSKNSGTIKNLTIKANLSTTISTSNWINVGAFAGVNEGTITNCILESYVGTPSHTLSNNTHIYTVDIYVGGINTARIGGITGYNKGIITNCKNNYASIFGKGDIGGIAGKSEGNGTTTGYIYNSDNRGNIYYLWDGVNRSIGGIVGYQESGIIDYCYNHGTISYDRERYEDASVKPWMGRIVGHKLGTVTRYNDAGGVLTGSLFNNSGFLGIGAYNQLEYAGNRAFGQEG